MRTIEQMIQSEVLVCVSSLVSTLAHGLEECAAKDLNSLCEQAFELAYPIADYEEAATQEGWLWDEGGPHFYRPNGFDKADYYHCDPIGDERRGDWEALCLYHGIEPYDREVFEHWAVTDWFADKLIAAGEKVDKDFAGMCVWARTTTGQGIAQDHVIQMIHAALVKS